LCDPTEEEEMRGTKDNTYGIKKEMNVGFWWGNVKQKKTWKN